MFGGIYLMLRVTAEPDPQVAKERTGKPMACRFLFVLTAALSLRTLEGACGYLVSRRDMLPVFVAAAIWLAMVWNVATSPVVASVLFVTE